MKLVNKIGNYLYTGIFSNTLAITFTGDAIYLALTDNWIRCAADVLLAGYTYMDGYKRFSEYKKFKTLIEEKGWDKRFVKQKTSTLCQEHAVRQAAN